MRDIDDGDWPYKSSTTPDEVLMVWGHYYAVTGLCLVAQISSPIDRSLLSNCSCSR